jgi:hypothetical protein
MLYRIKILYVLFLLPSFLMAVRNTPDIVTKVGTAAGNWLKLETGTRAIGMSGAHVAVGNGIYAAPYNPASIGFVEGSETFFSRTNYVADIKHSVFGYAKQLSLSDYIGFHIFYMDSGDMLVTDVENPDGYGEYFSVTAFSLRGMYTKMLTDRLKVGASVKYVREDIYTAYMHSFVFDIGSNFDTGIYGMILGMSVSNFGPEVKFSGEGLEIEVDESLDPDEKLQRVSEEFPLPLTFRLGVSNEVIGPNSAFLNIPGSRLTVAFDAINSIDYSVYGCGGLEYAWNEMAFLRAGTHLGHDTAGFSLGAGVKYRGINVDYAFVNYGILETTHQFGIGLDF